LPGRPAAWHFDPEQGETTAAQPPDQRRLRPHGRASAGTRTEDRGEGEQRPELWRAEIPCRLLWLSASGEAARRRKILRPAPSRKLAQACSSQGARSDPKQRPGASTEGWPGRQKAFKLASPSSTWLNVEAQQVVEDLPRRSRALPISWPAGPGGLRLIGPAPGTGPSGPARPAVLPLGDLGRSSRAPLGRSQRARNLQGAGRFRRRCRSWRLLQLKGQHLLLRVRAQKALS